MNAFWTKISSFFASAVHRKVLILVGCGLAVVGAGIGAAMGYHASLTDVPVIESASVVSTVRVLSSSRSQSVIRQDSSSVSEEEDEPLPDIALFLVPSSATQDLNVNIVDENGTIVRDVAFLMNVQGIGEENGDYARTFEIDLKDGNLYLSHVPAGPYLISLEDEPGFVTPEPVEFEVESFEIVYEEIEDIEEIIVDEKDVDVAHEDNGYGQSEPAPVVQDTVKYVESTVKEIERQVTDPDGKQLYTYTYELSEGYLKNKDGSVSDVLPVLQDGVLIGGVRCVATGEKVSYPPEPVSDPVPDPMQPSESESTESQSDSESLPEQPVPLHRIVFVDLDGAVLSDQTVPQGESAVPPEAVTVERDGKLYVPTGMWVGSYAEVVASCMVPAEYEVCVYETVSLFREDNTPVDTYQITAQPQTEKEYLYTGWQTLDGKTYYFTEENKAVTGWQIIQGISYFFNNDGVRSDCLGIDVSKYQGNIDWNAVKASGISFAIIRVGYRGYGTGALVEDSMARTNLAGATAAGIKVGVYVFSQAINQQEAIEEASLALKMVEGYSLAYPIFIDSEYSTSARSGRADGLSVAQRTAVCAAFCQTVANAGYKTGVYASKSWFEYQLSIGELSAYHIWLAHYTTATNYAGRYDIWQYSASGSVPGISGAVDMDMSYLNY